MDDSDAASLLAIVLGHAEQTRMADRLADSFDSQHGFPAQHTDIASFSAATTGICFYALRRVFGDTYHPVTPTYFERCVRPDGSIDPELQGSNISTSNWSRSQVLMALSTWQDDLANELRKPLTAALIASQHSSGGFAIREFEDEGPNPLVTHYCILGLCRQLPQLEQPEDLVPAIEGAGDFMSSVLNDERETLDRRLLAASGLRIVAEAGFPVASAAGQLPGLENGLSNWGGLDQLENVSVTSVRHPLWFTEVWRPGFTISALKLFGLDAAATRTLAVELARHYVPSELGWAKNLGSIPVHRRPYAWATALGLLSVHELRIAVKNTGVTAMEWADKSVSSVRRLGRFDYDVAVTFSGHDRETAAQLVGSLEAAGLRVFFDDNFRHALLGEDLGAYLQDTYFARTRYVVPLLSEAFIESKWANWEWRAVLARMVAGSGRDFVLPYYLNPPASLQVEGLNPTIGYLTLAECEPEEFAKIVARKVVEADC